MDKTDMQQKAAAGLRILREYIEICFADRDFDSASAFFEQYSGAVFMLRQLDLISAREARQYKRYIWKAYATIRLSKEAE